MRRLELGKTQEDLVSGSNDLMTQAWVTDVERGRIDLANAGFSKVVMLAKLLGWSLFELQQTTGVDLGMGKPESNATIIPDEFILVMCPVYPLQEAVHWPSMQELDQTVDVPKKGYAQSLRIFLEGDRTLHFVDTEQRKPAPNHRYLILHNNQPLICDCKAFGDQGVFIGPLQQLVPLKEARVLGQLLETRINHTPTAQINQEV